MRIVGYTQDSTADGEGLRDVLFLSHCPHKCKGCHNPETWSEENGELFTPHMKAKLIKQLQRLKEPSLTLSGGDPLSDVNYVEVLELVKELKGLGVNLWVYTGYTLEELYSLNKSEVLKYINVLVDGKFEQENKSETSLFRGSSNQRIHVLN